MPKWLDTVTPHISIEGAEFFEQRDHAVPPERELVTAGAAVGPDSDPD